MRVIYRCLSLAVVITTTSCGTRGGPPTPAAGPSAAVDAGPSPTTDASPSATSDAGPSPTVPSLQGVTIAPEALSVPRGLSARLTPTGSYSDGTTAALISGLSWASSDPGVAAVDGSGVVTAVAPGGPIRITAVDDATGRSGSAQITVTSAALQLMSLDPMALSLPSGLTRRFAATASYSDGTSAVLSAGLSWTSSDGAIAAVDASGVVTARAPGGPVSVTATDDATGISASAPVTVTDAVLLAVSVDPAAASLPRGLTRQLTATGEYSDGTLFALTSGIAWASSDPGIADVDGGGVVSALAPGGPATITVTEIASGQSAAASIEVTDAVLLSVSIAPAELALPSGLTRQLTATGNYSDGTTAPLDSGLTWTSGDLRVATVAGGLVTAVAPGGPISISIAEPSSGATGSASVTVTSAVIQSVSVAPSPLSLARGSSRQLTATGTYSDGTTMALTSGLTWRSSDSAIATVTGAGLVTARAVGGPIVVTVTDANGASADASVTVGMPALASLAVSPGAANLPAADSRQFRCTGTYSDGTTQPLPAGLAWATGDAGVATVSASGLVSAVSPGSTYVQASSEGIRSNRAKLRVR